VAILTLCGGKKAVAFSFPNKAKASKERKQKNSFIYKVC
jgi:hypothetical protein